MSVNRSGYYKWLNRQSNPSKRMLQRESDISLIRDIHEKHPSHGYRWINAYVRQKYGIIWSDHHVHLCCKYANIKYQGKHYQWKKPGEQQYKFNSLMSTATYRSYCTDAGAVWSGGSCKWAKGTKTTDRGSINTNYRTCQSNANVKAIKSITNEQ